MSKRVNFLRKTFFLLMTASFVFNGCAPIVIVSVERPPKYNTSGIKRIAIMPFEGDNSYGVAQYSMETAISAIMATNYFTLVEPSVIRNNQENLENYVDATFLGQIKQVSARNEAKVGSSKKKDGTVVYYTDNYTHVVIDFSYSLIRARDGSIIGPINKSGKRTEFNRDKPAPIAEEVLKKEINKQFGVGTEMFGLVKRRSPIATEFVPYTVQEKRTFAKDKSGNETVKSQMQIAIGHVKTGNFKIALQAYLGIYEQYKSIAAAENAAILYEALGDIKAAAALMQQVVNSTGNPKAQQTLYRLNKDIQDMETVAAEYKGDQTLVKKVANIATEEIQMYLPSNAKLWIYNDSPNSERAVSVVSNITTDFIRKGFSVVDRESVELIIKEINIQMSGFVSDNDIVNMGHAAGANTIIRISETGTGATRRLNVKMLDIESGTIKFQSGTEDKWNM